MIDSLKIRIRLKRQIDGQLIRLPIPNLSEERRNDKEKMVKAMGENAKFQLEILEEKQMIA